MKCLSDEQLLDVQLGDVAPETREHVGRCAACATRARALARDLARLDTVLHQPPPAARALAWHVRWTPLAAVAAALVLGVAVQRFGAVSMAPADDIETATLLDELSDTVLADADDTSDAEASRATVSSETRSTCAWGDPLLGVGCNELTVTLVAWR